jgi:quercetin dioxygenase-like cupin family protein
MPYLTRLIKMDRVGVEPTTSAMLKFHPASGKLMTHHDDAVKVAPDSYKVVLENESVRVLEVRIKKGAKSEMHSHPKSVAICLNEQRLRFTFPNSKSEDTDLKHGQAVWLDGLSHAVENVGNEDVSSVVVELKK